MKYLSGLCLALICVAPAARATTEVDAIYLALGQDEMANAAKSSAALLARKADSADVLQARLDVLYLREELDKPEGVRLHDAISSYVVRHPHGRALDDLFVLEAAITAHQAKVALQQAKDMLAAPTRHAPEDAAELLAVQARAAALTNGELEQARESAESALQAWKPFKGIRADWHRIQLHYIIGNVHYFSGDKNVAVAEFERAAKQAADTFGADSAARLKMDNELASALVQLGRNGEALQIRESIFAATRRRSGDVSVAAAKAEAMIGAGLQEIGDYATARKRYEHAEQTLAQIKDPPPHDLAIIDANYGNLLQEMGEADAALAHYRAALTLVEADAQTTHLQAVVTANMGNTEFRLHHYDTAIDYFQRALALREQADGKDNPGLGFALEGLGSSSLALKRYADAQQYFTRALQVRGRSLPPDHPTLAVFNFGLALAHWGQQHSDDAFRYAMLTAKNQHTLLSTFASEFSERQSVAYRDVLVPATALVVTLAAERGDAQSIAAAWGLTMVERGLVARAQARRLAAARSAKDPELAKVWEAWRHANSALGEAWLATNTTPQRMEQLHSAAEDAERTLWLRLGRDPGEALRQSPEVATLANNLPEDGLLLAFAEGTAGDVAGTLAAGDKSAPDVWFAFALRHDGKPVLRRVGDIAALSAQVDVWYRGLRDPASDAAALRRNGLALRHELLDPFVDASAPQHLFVVPEGELFRVSFAALPLDRGGYLVEGGARVHTLDHEADLMLAPPSASAVTLLAGAPNFPELEKPADGASRALCLRASRQGFAAIPNAARELDGLQSLLTHAADAPQVRMVAGAQATKENVLAALPQANVIHIATHGFSLDSSCAEAGATRGVSVTASEGADSVSSSAAISGLAFSGADVAQGHDPIGVLSAGELGTLDLSHADWIALSACDSGLGPIGRNEGVFGMRRALRVAGARTVVMSLWQVDDAATADLMQTLYTQRFVDHRDVPGALTGAMRSVLEARRAAGQSDHPYYWAAFIGEGGWR